MDMFVVSSFDFGCSFTLYVPIMTGKAVDKIVKAGQVDFFRLDGHPVWNFLIDLCDFYGTMADEPHQ